MNCDDMQALLHAYLDEELDGPTARGIKGHLDRCPRCSEVYHQLQRLQNALRVDALYASAPIHLRRQVQGVLDGAEQTGAVRDRKFWVPLRVAFLLLALFSLCLLVLSFPLLATTSGGTAVPQQVVANYQHTLQSKHLVDISSSDRQKVKAWFVGKITYTPPTNDFAEQGFSLIGGRVDSLETRPVAVLVYRHGTHIVSLYLWPAPGLSSPKLQTFQSYHLCSWTQSGLTYWAISTLDMNETQHFVHLVQQQGR